MTHSIEPQQVWQPCPQGTLAKLVARQTNQRRREFLKQAGLGSLTIFAVATGTSALLLSRRSGSNTAAGIPCTTVLANMEQYVAKQLDRDLARQIATHLQQCRQCHRILVARFPGAEA